MRVGGTGKGTISEAVWKLKLVWDHAGTGSVKGRGLTQQIDRAEKRLGKLNAVEAQRLKLASAGLEKAMRACKGAAEIVEAADAVEEGRRVGHQLDPTSVEAETAQRPKRKSRS